MENKPLKRNKNIIILSREHHDGLLFAWKLKQGIAQSIERSRMAKYISYFRDTHLAEHFREEETLLFCRVQHPLIDKALQQHADIRILMDDIAGKESENTAAYSLLANLLADHIRFEERELFPFLEKTLSSDQLDLIGEELEKLHQSPVPDDYPDEFWIQGKVADPEDKA